MANESRSPQIQLGELKLEVDNVMRDNIVEIKDALERIELILVDIDNRLKAVE